MADGIRTFKTHHALPTGTSARTQGRGLGKTLTTEKVAPGTLILKTCSGYTTSKGLQSEGSPGSSLHSDRISSSSSPEALKACASGTELRGAGANRAAGHTDSRLGTHGSRTGGAAGRKAQPAHPRTHASSTAPTSAEKGRTLHPTHASVRKDQVPVFLNDLGRAETVLAPASTSVCKRSGSVPRDGRADSASPAIRPRHDARPFPFPAVRPCAGTLWRSEEKPEGALVRRGEAARPLLANDTMGSTESPGEAREKAC